MSGVRFAETVADGLPELVVPVIVGVPTIIGTKGFAKARKKARMASCQSNLKQIGIAAAMYAQDYDERLCPAIFAPTQGVYTNLQYWADLLQPYIRNRQVTVCPSFAAYQNGIGYGYQPQNTYSFNAAVQNPQFCGHSLTNAPSLSLAQITDSPLHS